MSFIDGIKEALGAAPVVDDLDEFINDDGSKDTSKDKPKGTSSDTSKTDEPKDDPQDIPKTDSKDTPKDDPKNAPDAPADDASDDATKQDDELIRKIIDEAIAAGDKPQGNPKPIPKEERENMRDFKFYDKIGEKMYDYDRGKEMSDDLRSWIDGAIEDDQFLSEEFVRKVLPKVLKKNPEIVDFVKSAVKQNADNAFVPFTLLFVNVKDADDKKEYETMHEACETIRREIDVFGVNPADVFKPVYRRIDAAGNLGERVSVETVEDFVDHFDGDKAALRKKLRLPKRDKADKKPNNPNKKQPNGSKKGDKKPNNNANNGGNASQNAGDAT